MILKVGRVALNGEYLDELDPSIVVRSIDPGTPQETVSAVGRMGYAGQRVTVDRYEMIEATVAYAIDIPKTDLQERRRVFDLVNDWARQKGWLTVSWMKGKRLYVDNVQFPSSGNLWDWTAEFTLAFRSYSVPFWRDRTAVTVTSKSAASGTVHIEMGGNVRSVLGATFDNKSGAKINKFSITVSSASGQISTISLTNLGLAANGQLVIDHRTDGTMRIRTGVRSGGTWVYTSVYEKYTGSDDLYAVPGTMTVKFTADRAGVLTITGAGRYV